MVFSPKLSLRTMVPFCRHLATSHAAGIPILRSLELVTRQTRDARLKRVVSRMAESITAGSTLEQAAREQSRYLPRFFIELVGAGEIGGRLDEIFDQLANYYERMADLVRRIRGKFVYPIFLLVFLVLVSNFMAALSASSTEYGVDFTKLGRVFAYNMGRLALYVMGAFVVLVILSRMGLLGWVAGAISTFVWPLAPVTRKLALSRFTRALGLLLRSGVPVTEAVYKAAAATNNPYIERSLLRCVPAIQAGESVSTALSACPYLSEMAREMLYSGEESGKLDQHLEKIADIHEAEAMQSSKNLVVVMGVLVLVLAATAIGIFVIRFWMAYYGALFDELGV
jgi:type IV pilus assembly protein PilC